MSKPTTPAPIGSADLDRAAFPPLRWIIRDLLPEGLTLLVGKPKLGKSWLALHMAVEVALGGDVLGQFAAEATPVLYYALEDGPRRLQTRQRTVYGKRAKTNRLRFCLDLPVFDRSAKGKDVLLRDLDVEPRAGLVIIDTLGRIQPTQAGIKNSYDADYKFTTEIQRIARDRNIAIMLVHHERKSVENDGSMYVLDKVLGTTGITGGADNIMIFQTEGGPRRRLHLTGREIEARDFAIEVDLARGSWSVGGAVPGLRAERQRVLDALRAIGQPVKAEDLVVQSNIPRSTVFHHLTPLREAGLVESKGGMWWVAENPSPTQGG